MTPTKETRDKKAHIQIPTPRLAELDTFRVTKPTTSQVTRQSISAAANKSADVDKPAAVKI
jgi:hypothetical protein